jgi:MFS family permease
MNGPASGSRAAVRRLALAGMISMTGSTAATIAVSYHIFKITGSAWWLSAVFVLTLGVGGLLQPFAGMLADRYDRRRLMVGSDLVGAALFAALVFAHSPRSLLLLVFVAALAAPPFRAAVFAAIPNLAGSEDLRWANSRAPRRSTSGARSAQRSAVSPSPPAISSGY